MSATYDECVEVRDIIAEAILDGVHVSAVGLQRTETRDWGVVVMAHDTGLTLPKIPATLEHVSIKIQQSDPFKVQRGK